MGISSLFAIFLCPFVLKMLDGQRRKKKKGYCQATDITLEMGGQNKKLSLGTERIIIHLNYLKIFRNLFNI